MRIKALLSLWLIILCIPICSFGQNAGPNQPPNKVSGDTVIINMVALDQHYFYNRLGAAQPTGQMYALEKDVIVGEMNPLKGTWDVRLREGKRPRPIVLRANEGDIVIINFTNYLRPSPWGKKDTVQFYPPYGVDQPTVNPIFPATRDAGVHITGMQVVNSIQDGGSFAGSNPVSGLVAPGKSITYTLFAGAVGTYLIASDGSLVGNGSTRGGTRANGLFGEMVVEPPQAEWYRSQVTEEELYIATKYWVIPPTRKGGSSTRLQKPAGLPSPAARQAIYDKGGYPVIDYNATFSANRTVPAYRQGMPILKMYKQVSPTVRELVHSDLTAIITGPNKGDFPKSFETTVPDFFPVYATPDRLQPYREFAIMYHEAPWAVQAFPEFYQNTGNFNVDNVSRTAQGGLDQFAINYGTGGISAEILANRVGVGPMDSCITCAYEEFFLSSWAVGDPAMVVDLPANVAKEQERLDRLVNPNRVLNELMLQEVALIRGDVDALSEDGVIASDAQRKATKALFPDDPSNVYHSYMNDHVKMRLAHAGSGITHVHHQHAAQWLHSPNSQNGHYLDSQTINPGGTYTLDMVYGGSGNVNKTVGDKIFHCHFYPHFAQGMWAHWRIHDVLEAGTVLDNPLEGTPISGARALPDAEIKSGTPIPGLVPIPNIAMAPTPARVEIRNGQSVVKDRTGNPGYPFFIAGVAGQRPPKPPLDFAQGEFEDVDGNKGFGSLDGGLPRSIVIGGEVLFENHTRYDWTKITDKLEAIELPEEGTYFEQEAMKAHAQREHATFLPINGNPGIFILNGLKPVPGAPYANPSVGLDGQDMNPNDENTRVYKAANIQIDAVINKLGWHYPQTRPIVLWGDVASTVAGDRPPQPFFFRANSTETIEYWHTNLVPEYYELDDYQVRTPTDVIGQHIHLVKFDVTSSDGAANGWNYEDGTFSPDFVREAIEHINSGKWYTPNLDDYFAISIKNTANPRTLSNDKLAPHKPNPIWGTPPTGQSWVGAQTTIQKWYADPLFNNAKTVDRTLRTVFTHDHLSPSTHQQIGLFAGLLIEPEKSTWLNSSTGDQLGTARPGKKTPRTVGTTYTLNGNGVPTATQTDTVSDGGPTNWQAIIETQRSEDAYREFMYEFQDNQQAYLKGSRATGDVYPHFGKGSTAEGFRDTVNADYRGWMDFANAINPPPKDNPEVVSTGNRGILSMNYRNEPLPARVQAGSGTSANAENLAYGFSSQETRGLPELNSQPTPGYIDKSKNKFVYPKQPISPGMQGGDPFTPLARAYNGDRIQVRTLVGSHVNPHFFNIAGVKWLFEPSNQVSGFRNTQAMGISEHFEMNFQLPYVAGAGTQKTTDYLVKTNTDETGMVGGSWGMIRAYGADQSDLAKVSNNSTPAATTQSCGCPSNAPERAYDVTAISIDKYQMFGENWGRLPYNERYRNYDAKAMIFVRTDDLNNYMHGLGYRPEPLVLRAAAGECIKVTLRNDITPFFNSQDARGTFSNTVNYGYTSSFSVGLHPELLSYDVGQYDGSNVGFNGGTQTLDQGSGTVNYEWYAGQWNQTGSTFQPEPVEFGSVVLSAPDPLEQYIAGLFGALIVEPEGSYWVENKNQYSNHTSANVYASKSAFDGGAKPLFREFVMIFQDNIGIDAEPIRRDWGAEANAAINYRSEPLGSRIFQNPTDFNSNATNSNKKLNFNPENTSDILTDRVVLDDPETPVFAAVKGTPVRFRLLHTGGLGDGNVFNLHGHVWQEEPYTDLSTKIGYNDSSQWNGTREQLGALNSFDLVIAKAGGQFEVAGDYLYLDWRAQPFTDGTWGVFRVTDGADATIVTRVTPKKPGPPGMYSSVSGNSTVDPNTGFYPKSVTLAAAGKSKEVAVDQTNGDWIATGLDFPIVSSLTVTSTLRDNSKGSERVYPGKELLAYTKERRKVLMLPVQLPTAKQLNPGENSSLGNQSRSALPLGPRRGGPNQ